MSPRPLRFLAALALAAATTSGFLPGTAQAAPADSWTDGPCTGSTGVTVVADFTHFADGTVVRRCDTGSPTTAYQAIDDVGLDPAHGAGQGQSGPYQYLCRIDDKPSAADDGCTGFATDAPYWAFWVPDSADTDWAYATEGVDTYAPPAGDVLGFSFGAGTTDDPNQMSLSLADARQPAAS